MLATLLELLIVLCKVAYHWLKAVVMAVTPTALIAKDISGQTVVITGAGSGLGRLLAVELASLHCRLALWDVNAAGNTETARLVRERGATVAAYTVDVSDRTQVYSAAAKVRAELGEVDVLVNNAGIVTGHRLLDCPDSEVDRTLKVNALAHFWTLKAFLPAMLSRDLGHVVSVASSAGLQGCAGLSDYCSSKFAAVGLTESLRSELRAMGKTGVRTTLVCPFLVDTGMFHGCTVRFPWLLSALSPPYVARQVVRAVLRNQEMIVLPRMLHVAMVLKGLLPIACQDLLADVLGATHIMDNFRGHKARSD